MSEICSAVMANFGIPLSGRPFKITGPIISADFIDDQYRF